jgi:hypothetical protein
MTADPDRLASIAELLSECPPPGIAGGQCAHGTWPCAITQATWLAQGRDRRHEIAAARQAEPADASRQELHDPQAAEREELLHDPRAETGTGGR